MMPSGSWKQLTVLTVLLGTISSRPHYMSQDSAVALNYLIQYHYVGHNSPDPSMASLTDTDPAEAVRRGITLFQRRYNLRETGTMTEETKSLMSMPRCGLPDINNMEETSKRKKRYALQGGKWDHEEISYRISRYPQDGDLTEAEVDRELYNALQVWQEVSPLTFRQKHPRDNNIDIDIKFESDDHGDGYPFDGAGNVLAHAFYPQYGGDAHFDEAEVWTREKNDGTNLFQVAAHEFGHSLGLAHSADPNALMAPFYAGYQPNFNLPDDDIQGIQRVYGVPKPKDPSTTTTTTTTIAPRPKTTPKPRVTERPRHVPDVCKYGTFDAITTHMEGSKKVVYAFRGHMYVRLDNLAIAPGYPRSIRGDWRGLPSHIDAALTWDAEYRNYWKFNAAKKDYVYTKEIIKPARTYFFKGSKYWRFENRKLQPGYPKLISTWGLPNDIDAAFVWSGNGKTYFTKGGKYYRYTKGKGVDNGYPRPLSVWEGLPKRVDTAFQYTNGKTYFFEGSNYYKFVDHQFRVGDGYPQQTTRRWLGCDKYHAKIQTDLQVGHNPVVTAGSTTTVLTTHWTLACLLLGAVMVSILS